MVVQQRSCGKQWTGMHLVEELGSSYKSQELWRGASGHPWTWQTQLAGRHSNDKWATGSLQEENTDSVSSEVHRQCMITCWPSPASQAHLFHSDSGKWGRWDKSISTVGLGWLLGFRSHGSAGCMLGCGSSACASRSHDPHNGVCSSRDMSQEAHAQFSRQW